MTLKMEVTLGVPCYVKDRIQTENDGHIVPQIYVCLVDGNLKLPCLFYILIFPLRTSIELFLDICSLHDLIPSVYHLK